MSLWGVIREVEAEIRKSRAPLLELLVISVLALVLACLIIWGGLNG